MNTEERDEIGRCVGERKSEERRDTKRKGGEARG